MSNDVESQNTSLDVLKWIVAISLMVAAIGGNVFLVEEYNVLYRAVAVVVLVVLGVLVALTTSKGQAFNQFRKDAFTEARRVTWPTGRETAQTTAVVAVVVLIVSLILWFIDWVLNLAVSGLIG